MCVFPCHQLSAFSDEKVVKESFNMHSNLGACWANKVETDANESAEALMTWKNLKTVVHLLASRI